MASETKEGNGDRSLLFFPDMNTEQQIQFLDSLVNGLLESDPNCFLVEIKIKPTNNFKVFLDADGGLSIDKCVAYNRALYKKIDESGLFPNGDFSLEVSSPGLDEPLKLRRQYVKNIGRQVEVVTIDGRKAEGKLNSVLENEIVLEQTEGKGKKQVIKNNHISFDQIKHTRIAVVF